MESIVKVFFDGVIFLSVPHKSFMQNWKQLRQGVEQQGKVMSRKEKLGDCNPEQLSPMDTRKKCQNG